MKKFGESERFRALSIRSLRLFTLAIVILLVAGKPEYNSHGLSLIFTDLLYSIAGPQDALAGGAMPVECKHLPLEGIVTLSPSGGAGGEGRYFWFGPFGMIDGLPTPTVNLPEGLNRVSYLLDNDGTISSAGYDIYVSSCFLISSSSSRGQVKLSWPRVDTASRYDIYRATGSSPSIFTKIGESTSTNRTITFVDGTVQNDSPYLYAVDAFKNGIDTYSNITAALPSASKNIPNQPPIIYSTAITEATVGIDYRYPVSSIDPNGDMVAYSLQQGPEGMTISTGRIDWKPVAAGSYPVAINVSDGHGGTTTQSFTITVAKLSFPISIAITASPENVAAGGTTTLTWTSAYAERVSIDHGIGIVPRNGSINASIQEATTFTATASGYGNSVEGSVSVQVSPSVSLHASPEQIPEGGTSYLSWSSLNADSVSIDQGIGVVPLTSTGQGLQVSPAATTTYTITASGPGGTKSAQASVEIIPAPAIEFTATPQTISPGKPANLTWTTNNADEIGIDNGIGTVSSSGSMAVSPSQTTTYTLTATGPGGTAVSSETITVMSAPSISFNADPENIVSGQYTTLTWSSANAESVSINNGIGTVAAGGSLSVCPTATTTYTITATNQGGSVERSVTVSVLQRLSIDSPVDGATIDMPETMVRGTINAAVEEGPSITVNGLPAFIDGNVFVANDVGLEPGLNVLSAKMYLPDGTVSEAAISVSANVDANHINLQNLGPDEGLAPLEISLKVDGNFVFAASPVISDSGPGPVQTLVPDEPDTIKLGIANPGLYFFTAQVQDKNGFTYTDSFAVSAMDRAGADAMLKTRWNGMKSALATGDIDLSLTYFVEREREKYRTLFQKIANIQTFANNMEEIEMISFDNGIGEYRIKRTETVSGASTVITYFIYFARDTDGRYKILKF